jgi:hypothetical protein
MPRFVKALVPLSGTQSVRLIVDVRRGRIRRVRLEVCTPSFAPALPRSREAIGIDNTVPNYEA